MSGRYRAPVQPVTAELREQGSVFLALLRPLGDEAELKPALAAVAAAHADATHHCWAARWGAMPAGERSADAGEPRGTAGPPILRALSGAGVSDALLVVSRWFGGVKLGKGGLARAYSEAARRAIGSASFIERAPSVELEIAADYESIGAVKRLLRPPEVELVDERYGAAARLVLRVWREREADLRAALGELSPRVSVDAHRRGR